MDIEKTKAEFEKSECFKRFEDVVQHTFFDFGTYCIRTDVPRDVEKKIEKLVSGLIFSWKAWKEAKAQAVPEWISTSERMPEEGEEVFVHSYGQVRQATRDSSWAGGFKERNCYGWQATYSQSHWIPKSIELPESFHFYYEHDAKVAKEKAMIEAQEQKITELKVEWASDCFECGHHEAIIYSTASEASTKGWFHDGDAVKCCKCGHIGEMDARGEDSDICWNEEPTND